ncbi:MAG: hypothetical protein C4K47_05410 [Candidatus Thorarchaeota archaeon]|nr:MAG: hypothetical protein C4K47_05410 [Candidatus Thorarchaeota archaeon]
MLPQDIVECVADLVSGIRSIDYVREISRFHRIQASPGFRGAIEYLKQEISKVSGAEVKLFEFPEDTTKDIETWESNYGWFPNHGVLSLLQPEQRILADFDSEPVSLIGQSCSADIETDVVYVGKGFRPEDFQGKEIAGKIVLAEGRASNVHKAACIERGAAGILLFQAPSGIQEVPDLRPYAALWPRPGEAQKTRFGFALTYSDGMKIKQWLEENKRVTVRANVDARLGVGKAEAVSALIKGTELSDEVWLVAHICHPHPSANDNASGSATLLEALRVISRMMREGKIPQPSLSIRFLWVPEWSGMTKMLHYAKETVAKCRFMVNADMVGADPSKTGSVLHLFRTPYSLPTTLNNVVRFWLATEVKRKMKHMSASGRTPLPWEYNVYSGGSDHVLLASKASGIPAVMLNQWPEPFWHTSADVPENLSCNQLEFVARVVVLTAVSLGLPSRTMKELVLTDCRNEAVEIIHDVGMKAVRELSACADNPETLYKRYLKWLDLALQLGQASIDSASHEWPLIEEQEALKQGLKASLDMTYTAEMVVVRRAYEGACAEAGLEPKDETHFETGSGSFNKEARRLIKYALNPGYMMKDPDIMLRFTGLQETDRQLFERIDEILNLCADWRSLDDVYEHVCLEFGLYNPSLFTEIVRDLERMKVIETREV